MKYLKLYENFIQTDSEIHELCEKYGIENYTINNGLVDVSGNVNLSDKKLSKLPIKFGNVSGDFYCDTNQLTSLDGTPQFVGGDFYCYRNQLTSLKDAPKEVGESFNCDDNRLTSLDGAPKSVSGAFKCINNQLTSLVGCPQEVGGSFNCNNNQLTSLEGAPKEVSGWFYCNNNKLTSLEGAEETICKNLDCSINNIYRLDFLPNYKGALYISKTPFYEVWKLIEDSIEKDYSLFNHFIENNIFRDPGYQGDTTGLPIIILDRLNDFLDMCKLPNVEEVEGYTCI
jgi:hypothetical protein